MTVLNAGYVKTFYCDKIHRLTDGVPINHRCRVLAPAFLAAEQAGDIERMIEVFEHASRVILHDGETDPTLDDLN